MTNNGGTMWTLEELKHILREQYDPDELIELFQASSDLLVEQYSDFIEDNFERLIDVVTARDISDIDYGA
jgi:hypothetical protein